MNSLTLLWIIFGIAVVGVSAVDLLVATRRDSVVSVASAIRWTVLWVFVALGFGVAIYYFHPQGPELAMPYAAGYLTEYSLSVDNLFVFLLIFSLMRVPEAAQPKLIKLGIYFSIVLRGIFILFGIALIHRFHWLLYVFGGLLIWTAWKMFMLDENAQIRPENNWLYKIATKLLPLHTGDPDGKNLFVRFEGRIFITPLFLVFLVIGSSDVLFALDSIPAIMGISEVPFVVLTSNVFAVLGLNSLFFAMRGIVGMFRFLEHGVSLVLFFIGGKMIACAYPPIDNWFKEHSFVSLIVIGTILFVSIVLSILHTRSTLASEIERPTPKQ